MATESSRSTSFVAIAAGLLSVVLFGFWFTYWKPVFSGESFPKLLHLHGALWFGWFVLLLIQTRLITSGSVRTHRQAGQIIVGYTCVLIAVSFAVAVRTIARDADLLTQSIESVPTIIPLTQILMFAVLFGIAVAYRARRETHKRLMILAGLVAVTPALARVSIGLLGNTNVPAIFVVSNLLIVLVGYQDWRATGRIHRVYLWGGIAILLVRALRIPLAMSPLWTFFARELSARLSVG